jgi:hypothetical protein
MLPEEDRQALKRNGYKISAKGVISPIAHPLQTHNRKSNSSAAQLGRQGERDSLNNSRATEPKATPIASNTRRYGSADAEERRRAGYSSGQPIKLTPPKQPKPPAEQQKGLFSPQQKFKKILLSALVKRDGMQLREWGVS